MVKISEISDKIISEPQSRSTWGSNSALERNIYCDDKYFYKIWSRTYAECQCFVEGDIYLPLGNPFNLHGLQVGFYVPEIASALVDTIHDDDGYILGYITRKGKNLESYDDSTGCADQAVQSFLDKIWYSIIDTRWAPSDVCLNNIISVDGKLSLIDFDSFFSNFNKINIDFERREGCQRLHTAPYLRGCVKGYHDIENIPA